MLVGRRCPLYRGVRSSKFHCVTIKNLQADIVELGFHVVRTNSLYWNSLSEMQYCRFSYSGFYFGINFNRNDELYNCK